MSKILLNCLTLLTIMSSDRLINVEEVGKVFYCLFCFQRFMLKTKFYLDR